MMKIHEVKAEILELEHLLEENPDLEGVVKDTIESLEGEFEEKIDNILLAAKNLELEAEAFKSEATRLKELSDQSSKQAERLKEYVDYACKLMNKTKFATNHFKVSYRKGSEVVNVADDAQVPEEYLKVKYEPMKTPLKEALKAGIEIPGVSLVRKPDSLVIK